MLKPCELRIEKTLEDGGKEVTCGAGGFTLKGPGDADGPMEAVCGACPIPDELRNDRWACLYLRPIRIRDSHGIKSYFSCRWFYLLNPARQPESIKTFCHGCIYWFPRPPRQGMITGYWAETETIRKTILDPPPPSNRFADWGSSSPPWLPRRSRWRMILSRILG